MARTALRKRREQANRPLVDFYQRPAYGDEIIRFWYNYAILLEHNNNIFLYNRIFYVKEARSAATLGKTSVQTGGFLSFPQFRYMPQ